jgi:hypothetical protein
MGFGAIVLVLNVALDWKKVRIRGESPTQMSDKVRLSQAKTLANEAMAKAEKFIVVGRPVDPEPVRKALTNLAGAIDELVSYLEEARFLSK